MRLNANTGIVTLTLLIVPFYALCSPRVVLVPYRPCHVPTYHQWMQDEKLRESTASDPLTLDEEYDMQRSWRKDGDKLTFIVCSPPPGECCQPESTLTLAADYDTPAVMVGDVNLFISEIDDDEVEDNEAHDTVQPPQRRKLVGEIELMVALSQHRGKGLGQATLGVFIPYVIKRQHAIVAEFLAEQGKAKPNPSQEQQKFDYLRVRIGHENAPSLRLFEKLGFEYLSRTPNVFGEVELRLALDEWKGRGEWRECEYSDEDLMKTLDPAKE